MTLDLLELVPGDMTLSLEPSRCRLVQPGDSQTLQVCAFEPNRLFVRFADPWPYELRGITAALECAQTHGLLTRISCTVDHVGVVEDPRFPGCIELRLSAQGADLDALRRTYRELYAPLYARPDLNQGDVVSLLERSGYIHLRAGGHMPGPEWTRASYQNDLSSDVVYMAQSGAMLGHVSVSRAYGRTWLGHQLTNLRDHDESAACWHALHHYMALVPTLFDGADAGYLMTYVDDTNPQDQRSLAAFVRDYADPDRATLVGFDHFAPAMTSDTEQLSVAESPSRAKVDQPRPRDLPEVVALLEAQLPALACRALDLDVETLDRAYLAPGYAGHGLPRSRRVFVVHEYGELVGVALCETGDTAVSLADLFNTAHIVCHPDISPEAQRDLVGFVHRFYRGLGCDEPRLLARPGTIRDPRAVGLDCVEQVQCMFWSSEALTSYRDHVDGELATSAPTPAANDVETFEGEILLNTDEFQLVLED